MDAWARPRDTHKTNTNTTIFFSSSTFMFLVFKLIFNRHSKLCGGSLRLCFDVSHLRGLPLSFTSHYCWIFSTTSSNSNILYVTNICSSLPISLSFFLTFLLTYSLTNSYSFALHLYTLECISTLMKYDRYDRVGRWFSFSFSLNRFSQYRLLLLVECKQLKLSILVMLEHVSVRVYTYVICTGMWTNEFIRVFVSYLYDYNFFFLFRSIDYRWTKITLFVIFLLACIALDF